MAVECRLVSYDKESCRLVGEIVNVSADEKILDENGKIDHIVALCYMSCIRHAHRKSAPGQ